ncbi:MAG: PilN domain-containing protein [Fimbriimonas sp.]
MPYINLIQEQRASSRKNEVRARAGFFTFVGVGVVSVLSYGGLFLKNADLKDKEASLVLELQRLEPMKKQIEANKEIESGLQPRLVSLEEAQQLTDRWIHILNHFTTQTPKNTWLTNVRSAANDPQKGVMVSLIGMSTSQDPVGEFMQRVQNEPNLTGVNLKYTNEKPTLGGPAIEFELEAEVAGTAPKKTKEEEDAK